MLVGVGGDRTLAGAIKGQVLVRTGSDVTLERAIRTVESNKATCCAAAGASEAVESARAKDCPTDGTTGAV